MIRWKLTAVREGSLSTARSCKQEMIRVLTEERDKTLQHQLVLEQNRNMYRGEAEKVNYDLATAEDKVQELEDDLEQKRQNIHKLNTEITRALEQKNYSSTRVVQLVTSNKEKDARINDLKEQLANAGNKMARRGDEEEE